MGAKFIDLTEKRFGKLTVLKREKNYKESKALWLCKCDCGKLTIKETYYLKHKKNCSCGCFCNKLYGINNPSYKHGLSKSVEYRHICSILGSMRCRCYNISNSGYNKYGGRGIKICDEWIDKETGFKNFYNWAMSNGYKIGLSIDRIDVNGNYEPSNCRWVTNKEQQNNKRNNHYITYNEETHTMKEWSEILNINYNVLRARLNNYNWSIEKAFKTPIKWRYADEDNNKFSNNC